jgi:hypothetical protein
MLRAKLDVELSVGRKAGEEVIKLFNIGVRIRTVGYSLILLLKDDAVEPVAEHLDGRFVEGGHVPLGIQKVRVVDKVSTPPEGTGKKLLRSLEQERRIVGGMV